MTKEENASRVIKREIEKNGVTGDIMDDYPDAFDSVQNGKMSAEKTDQIVEAVQKRKRGSKSASIEATTTATKEEISENLSHSLYWYHYSPVKTDEECAERLNEYFARVRETGEIPTVEKMCLALGVTRMTVWEWENGGRGASPERGYMIKKAKEILSSMDAELVQKNKIPQVTYIFRAKNYYGMRDQTDVVVTPNNPVGDAASQKELAEKYEDIYDE